MLADCDAGALRELVQRVRTLADKAIERGAARGVIDRAAWRPLKLLSMLWCANRASRLVLDDPMGMTSARKPDSLQAKEAAQSTQCFIRASVSELRSHNSSQHSSFTNAY